MSADWDFRGSPTEVMFKHEPYPFEYGVERGELGNVESEVDF
jgi:hypothetical protein